MVQTNISKVPSTSGRNWSEDERVAALDRYDILDTPTEPIFDDIARLASEALGAPIAHDVASVTVLHDSAMMADAWATAITVMGQQRGMALATRHGLAARLVRRDGGRGIEYMTPALAAMLG